MLFTLIFLGLLVAGWLICAYIPWVIASLLTRGHAGMAMLPLCLFAGLVAAVAVPLLGADGVAGLWVSFALAALTPAALLAAHRAAQSVRAAAPSATPPEPDRGGHGS